MACRINRPLKRTSGCGSAGNSATGYSGTHHISKMGLPSEALLSELDLALLSEEEWTRRMCRAVEAEQAAVVRSELHIAQAAPADVAAVMAPPAFFCRVRVVAGACEREEEDRAVTPR
eukprot:CAMPEP_0172554208 /NCGR_PEP_ID=MMETSP1067-20121228/53653_1 /TAXON_ID=265564 ORGANISM="Thalassiosira punctigera, Strain Tpunct2005C2" /NCGR_SAMPLE_ID=MMETSP1067 /ASSEMBLY_ACC=CAM_ASM_000444 /LENGTH=117 /DNA_ID=CAMNT_0013342535 /DNA_START=208 /DNA_END=562 /DNA_ORIENTATION=+